VIAHLDLDAFFAAVELHRRPDLRGTPLVVGGDPRGRGVVSTASYEARKYGIRSAMSCAEALRRCPQAVFVRPDHSTYREWSRRVWDVVREQAPVVEQIGIDEGYLVLAEGDPPEQAALVQRAIREQVRLSASLGVGSCKVVCKIASDMKKPGGITHVLAGEEAAFLAPLEVRRLPGVGPKGEQRLAALAIGTIGGLAALDDERMKELLPGRGWLELRDRARGIDPRPVSAEPGEAISISTEETFDVDIADPQSIRRELLRLSDRVGARLRGSGHTGRTVAVKLRRADFTTITRARTLREPTDLAREIYATACALYAASGLEYVPLRLVGVRVENLASADGATRQLALGEPETGWREAEKAMDLAARRFGAGAVRPAALVRPDGERDAYYGKEGARDD
jgi:DNA polymerase-4